MPQKSDARIGKLAQHGFRAVCRAVIDDDVFEFLEALPEDAADCKRQKVSAVEGGGYNGDARQPAFMRMCHETKSIIECGDVAQVCGNTAVAPPRRDGIGSGREVNYAVIDRLSDDLPSVDLLQVIGLQARSASPAAYSVLAGARQCGSDPRVSGP